MDTKRLCESNVITALQTPMRRRALVLFDPAGICHMGDHGAEMFAPAELCWATCGSWMALGALGSSHPLPTGGSVGIRCGTMQLVYARTSVYPKLSPKSLQTRLEHHSTCQMLPIQTLRQGNSSHPAGAAAAGSAARPQVKASPVTCCHTV